MNRDRFQDKVVIVTGGSRGIGAAACTSFAKEGAKLVIADILAEQGKKLSDELNSQGYKTIFIKTDVSQEQEIIDLIDNTVEKYGRLDVMCANAAIIVPGLPNEWDNDALERYLDVNIKGVLWSDKHAIAQMMKQDRVNGSRGSIVNTGSMGSLVATRPNSQLYFTTKGAVRMATLSYAVGCAADGIRVNCLCPGGIRTEMVEAAIQLRGEEWLRNMEASHPLGRMGTMQEAANCMLFLASDEASFVTGICLSVDGGYTAE